MSASVLQQIAQKVQQRLDFRREQVPQNELEHLCLTARQPLPFIEGFTVPGIHTIAEIKFKSPAVGTLRESGAAAAVQIAQAYLNAGTTAISVLTEVDYFQGHPTYLQAVRQAFPQARLLMKDFMLEEYQLLEAKRWGADAILLIVALLGPKRTATLLRFAQQQGLTALVEVHDADELACALAINAPLIGINNRNLKTLQIDLQTSFELMEALPPTLREKHVFISESGIQSASEIRALARAGFQGFLIGSSLMSGTDPGLALADLLNEANGE